jgi:hypothetical protein
MKKVMAIMAVVAMVAVSSVAYAQTAAPVTVNATVNASSDFTTDCETLALDMAPDLGTVVAPYGDGYDFDTASCTLNIQNNAGGWTLDMVESTTFEPDMLKGAETTHPDIIADCDDGGVPGACDLSTSISPANSAWGLYFSGTLVTDAVACEADNTACKNPATAVGVVTSGSIANTSTDLRFNARAIVDYQVTASAAYSDGVTLTYTPA